jgi:hypothetical protein
MEWTRRKVTAVVLAGFAVLGGAAAVVGGAVHFGAPAKAHAVAMYYDPPPG